MKLLVTGPGRGGTNWLIEIIRSSNVFNVTKVVEDRKFFNHKKLPNNYATKLTTENEGFSWDNLNKQLQCFPDLKILFIFRHPVANCMAKIYRGQPKSKGGDGTNNLAGDATVKASVKAVKKAFKIYTKTYNRYLDRVLLVRLEDLIKDLESEINRICKFLNIEKNPTMMSAHKNNRNTYQRKRYKNKIDTKQTTIHKEWHTSYGGFFRDRKKQIDRLYTDLRDIIEYLGYTENGKQEITPLDNGTVKSIVIPKPDRVIYTRGTIGDSFIILCKLYRLAQKQNILCKHYTAHKKTYNTINEILTLLPNVRVEFIPDVKNEVYLHGNFCYKGIDGEIDKYKYDPEFYPDFDVVNLKHFKLPNNYITVQTNANKSGKKTLNDTVINKLIQKSKHTVVLVGKTNKNKYKGIIDLREKTSILEVINIIKGSKRFHGSQGFLGFVALSQKVPTSLYLKTKDDRIAVSTRIECVDEWLKNYSEGK